MFPGEEWRELLDYTRDSILKLSQKDPVEESRDSRMQREVVVFNFFRTLSRFT